MDTNETCCNIKICLPLVFTILSRQDVFAALGGRGTNSCLSISGVSIASPLRLLSKSILNRTWRSLGAQWASTATTLHGFDALKGYHTNDTLEPFRCGASLYEQSHHKLCFSPLGRCRCTVSVTGLLVADIQCRAILS